MQTVRTLLYIAVIIFERMLFLIFSHWSNHVQGPASVSNITSYREISWSLEAARLVVWIIASLGNLTVTSAAVSSTVDVPVKFQSYPTILKINLMASRLREILQ